jgi:Fe-S-cluster-containing dehydrogenase component
MCDVKMTAKWNLVIDIDRCNGCYNCALAAKDEYVDNSVPGYFAAQPRHGHDWVKVSQHERGQYPALDVSHIPTMCNHCDDAPCIKAAPRGAVSKRPDGIVIIDPEKARGQKAIVEACPYGAVYWNEELQLPQHWPFDAHLLDRGWKAPRCVEVCATGAITAHKIDDRSMKGLADRDGLSVLRPELGTKPRVYYRNLKRAQTEFIAGTVVMIKGTVVECASDAEVVLQHWNTERTVRADAFGDFRFDGLERGTGPYRIVARHEGASAAVTVAELTKSLFVGKLVLNESA